jgi:hypothetical protein
MACIRLCSEYLKVPRQISSIVALNSLDPLSNANEETVYVETLGSQL